MMMNKVIKRIRARPVLTRSNKSYSDSTMETAGSSSTDNQSIPSNSIRTTTNDTDTDTDDKLNDTTNHSTTTNNNNNEFHDNEEEEEDDEADDEDETDNERNTNDDVVKNRSLHRRQQQFSSMSSTVSTTTRSNTSCTPTTKRRTITTRMPSSSSLSTTNSNNSSTHNHHHTNPTTTTTTTTTTTVVSFALDYNTSNEVIESSCLDMTDDEIYHCFYTASELNSFDRDRALTVLMYQTRNKSIPWDDNIHSIRGLEEHISPSSSNDETNTTSTSATNSSNTTSSTSAATNSPTSSSSGNPYSRNRYKVIQAVLNEQTRLRDTEQGRKEVCIAAKGYGISQQELIRELLRGVSCSMSKSDKQRSIQIAQKDEKEVCVMNRNNTNNYGNNIANFSNTILSNGIAFMNFTPNSRRKYLSMVKGKINEWSNTSNKSINSERSTTSSISCNATTSTTNNNNSRHRKKSMDLNDTDDEYNTTNNNTVDDHDDHEDDDDDDVDDEETEEINHNRSLTLQQQQHHHQPPVTPKRTKNTSSTKATWFQSNKSPLHIIQQVVYETSKKASS